MIIGLTGKNCSGKGEVSEFLKKTGFLYHSLSDELRAEMDRAGIEITRENLIQFGTKLREEHGPSYLAGKVLAKLDPEKNYVIDSIRNPGEVVALRCRKDFTMVRIESDARLRFDRMRSRARKGDPTTLEQFSRAEMAETKRTDPAAQQLDAVAEMADAVIENSGDLETLHANIRLVVRDLASAHERPDWHDYFMDIAKVVALRSNCLKRKVAAVIAKDKRIVSTGYNGTPRGIQNCSDGGCPRCNSLGASGQGLETCLCSHAEENAIVQSAYHGVSIKGATLYSTLSPCLLCTKMIINAGIAEVVYQSGYPLEDVAQRLLQEAGVKTTLLETK